MEILFAIQIHPKFRPKYFCEWRVNLGQFIYIFIYLFWHWGDYCNWMYLNEPYTVHKLLLNPINLVLFSLSLSLCPCLVSSYSIFLSICWCWWLTSLKPCRLVWRTLIQSRRNSQMNFERISCPKCWVSKYLILFL